MKVETSVSLPRKKPTRPTARFTIVTPCELQIKMSIASLKKSYNTNIQYPISN